MRLTLFASMLVVPIGLMPLAARAQAQAQAQAQGQAPAQAPAANAPSPENVTASVPDHVDIHFTYGSAQIGPDEQATLDRVAALYRQARPRVMIVTGATDATGDRAQNLDLSLRRARSVLQALVDRGLPEGLFEIDARGQNDPPVPDTGAQPRDRVTIVTWKLAATG